MKWLARYFQCFTPRFMSPQDLVRHARSVRGELGCPCCSAASALPLALPFVLEPSFRLLCALHVSLFMAALPFYLPIAPSVIPGASQRPELADAAWLANRAPPGGLVTLWGCPAAAPSRSGASSAALGQSPARLRAACTCCWSQQGRTSVKGALEAPGICAPGRSAGVRTGRGSFSSLGGRSFALLFSFSGRSGVRMVAALLLSICMGRLRGGSTSQPTGTRPEITIHNFTLLLNSLLKIRENAAHGVESWHPPGSGLEVRRHCQGAGFWKSCGNPGSLAMPWFGAFCAAGDPRAEGGIAPVRSWGTLGLEAFKTEGLELL